MKQFSLPKRHKLCSRRAIDDLFTAHGDVSSAIAYPLRAVWRRSSQGDKAAGDTPDRFMISVPKKRLRKAVDRVRMRRLVREAYRLNRIAALAADTGDGSPRHCSVTFDIAFVYVANELRDYKSVERAMIRLLKAIRPLQEPVQIQESVQI